MKYHIEKSIFRLAFLIMLIYVVLTLHTNGLKTANDFLNYEPYICCNVVGGQVSPTSFDGGFIQPCEFVYKGKTQYIPLGSCIGQKPNIFYSTATLLLFCIFALAFTINHFSFNKKVEK